MPLKIAHVVAEYAGLAQTGGLADAVGAISKEMAGAGHDVRVFLPLYADIEEAGPELLPLQEMRGCTVSMGETEYTFDFSVVSLQDSGAVVYLIDCPEAYSRSGIYSDGPDEHRRFALLARAALEGCQRLGWAPAVLHCHDWHAGLLPWYAKSLYSWDPLFARSRTVLTIHNLAYQGVFTREIAEELEAPRAAGDADQVVNYLETGIRYADRVTTVSPSYAKEILTPEHGMGLDGVLRHRDDQPIGILNGVDHERWDPSHDALIPRTYSLDDLSGKQICRQELLESLGLRLDPSGPVFGIVSRLANQKGLELVISVLPEVLEREDSRLVVLGTGEAEYEALFSALANEHREKVAFRSVFDLELAHRIEAGSDVFLMPSRFEPCGLNQMYSLRYGTPPVVHRTGGLADTVEPFDPQTAEGTGFAFTPFGEAGFRTALEEALKVFRQPRLWRRLMANGMSRDFSWSRRVEEYLQMYRRLVARDL
jgi:starch synthase